MCTLHQDALVVRQLSLPEPLGDPELDSTHHTPCRVHVIVGLCRGPPPEVVPLAFADAQLGGQGGEPPTIPMLGPHGAHRIWQQHVLLRAVAPLAFQSRELRSNEIPQELPHQPADVGVVRCHLPATEPI
eukprot:6895220-Alexandrium_andersonii.AAC.1